MKVDPRVYIHDSDKKALEALKAIPGFTQLLKAFMKIWNERQFAVQNMSSNLKLGPDQMPEYYNMLPPICEKLGIEVPELYLTMDVVPNAYTSGETKPFIVMTSGLLDNIPKELIPTVLAHECGHIACHHVLYHTMGQMLLEGSLLGLNVLSGIDLTAIALPLKTAFFHWMRCSEFSADRAAAVCDGSSENIVKMCMAFAGYGKNNENEANAEAFMAQAVEYREMVDTDKWNKALEFMMLSTATHPLTAMRAYECNEWCKQEMFGRVSALFDGAAKGDMTNLWIPMAEDASYFMERNYNEVYKELTDYGFSNVTLNRMMTPTGKSLPGHTVGMTVNGQSNFAKNIWLPATAEIILWYYEPTTNAELAQQYPGYLPLPNNNKHYKGMDCRAVAQEFMNAGFTNITYDARKEDVVGLFAKEGQTYKVLVNGRETFACSEMFHQSTNIHIIYHSNNPYMANYSQPMQYNI